MELLQYQWEKSGGPLWVLGALRFDVPIDMHMCGDYKEVVSGTGFLGFVRIQGAREHISHLRQPWVATILVLRRRLNRAPALNIVHRTVRVSTQKQSIRNSRLNPVSNFDRKLLLQVGDTRSRQRGAAGAWSRNLSMQYLKKQILCLK